MTLHGFIKDVSYQAHCNSILTIYDFTKFDVNTALPSGLIQHEQYQLAYSKWVSPKRTRSYPFERIYNTFNASKIVTIIPIIKDEGRDGDLDKIQYSTFSWMSLLNVYVVLGYYDSATKNFSPKQAHKHKITRQHFNTGFVNAQLLEIMRYHQSALHWNRSLVEERFTTIFEHALESYKRISNAAMVQMHSHQALRDYIAKIHDDFNVFKNLSLQSSQSASRREMLTTHKHEFLQSTTKADLVLENYLGGLYYLTADEVLLEGKRLILQESKNATTSRLPGISDIKDGLFKLILFSNLDTLLVNGKKQEFRTRLKLTGVCKGKISLHTASAEDFEDFYKQNPEVTPTQKILLTQLQQEAQANGIEIIIASNITPLNQGGGGV
jgi:hypothetical protein